MGYKSPTIGILLAGAGALAPPTAKDWQSVFAVDKTTLDVKGEITTRPKPSE
jgi:hypothetical protein